MNHRFASKIFFLPAVFVLSAIMLISYVARASESYPEFNQKYWEGEKDNAKGKILRGAILGAVGVAAVAPTTVLTIKAVKNPEKFLAYSLVSGVAAIGLTFHGFFSVSFGAEQRDKADYFINQYKNDPSSVSRDEEQAYYMNTEKKSTAKTIIFGAVLGAQGAILLTNGIVLSVRKRKGISIGGIKVWPTYLLGGLLLAGGTSLAAAKTVHYRQLKQLENNTTWTATAVMIRPYFRADPDTSSLEGGLMGQWGF
jgi:hypothetical protein